MSLKQWIIFHLHDQFTNLQCFKFLNLFNLTISNQVRLVQAVLLSVMTKWLKPLEHSRDYHYKMVQWRFVSKSCVPPQLLSLPLPRELTWASSEAFHGVKRAAVDFITLQSLPFHS